MSRENFKIGAFFGIGNRIKQIREKIGMTQSQFAEALGFNSPSAVFNYEKGRTPQKDVLDKIAELGEVSVDWLLRGEEFRAGETREELAVCPTHLNIDLLAQILEAAERYQQKYKRPLPAHRKALAISLLYDHFWEGNEDVTDSIVARYMKLA